jgi:hypothetical protein
MYSLTEGLQRLPAGNAHLRCAARPGSRH